MDNNSPQRPTAERRQSRVRFSMSEMASAAEIANPSRRESSDEARPQYNLQPTPYHQPSSDPFAEAYAAEIESDGQELGRPEPRVGHPSAEESRGRAIDRTPQHASEHRPSLPAALPLSPPTGNVQQRNPMSPSSQADATPRLGNVRAAQTPTLHQPYRPQVPQTFSPVNYMQSPHLAGTPQGLPAAYGSPQGGFQSMWSTLPNDDVSPRSAVFPTSRSTPVIAPLATHNRAHARGGSVSSIPCNSNNDLYTEFDRRASAPINSPANRSSMTFNSPLTKSRPFAAPSAPYAVPETLDNRRDSDATLNDPDWPEMQEGDTLDKEKPHKAYQLDEVPDPAAKPVTKANGEIVKPSLRRGYTEDQVRREPAKQAVDLVNNVAKLKEIGVDPNNVSGGVLSNLLKLYTPEQKGRPRSSSMTSASSWGGTSVAQSRSSSVDPSMLPHGGRPGLRQRGVSDATSVNNWELDPEDPRMKAGDGTERPAGPRGFSFNVGDNDDEEGMDYQTAKANARRRRSTVLNEDAVVDVLSGKTSWFEKGSKRKKQQLAVSTAVADIIQRHTFILKLAKALMVFGAPSHRLEAQLNATARALEVDAQFIHLPSIVIASFGDTDTHTSETHFVKAGGGLNLGSLTRVHEVYRAVVHKDMSVIDGSTELSRVLKAKPIYKWWIRVAIAAVCAGVISMLGFGGSFVDGLISAVFGAVLALLQLRAAAKSAMYSNIFEISIATLVSFAARGLDQTDIFCYQAISSAGVVLVLPGYVILCGSLELASRNIVTGSVKLVYAIIYSLFLGFGIAIGSDFYYLLDQGARARSEHKLELAGGLSNGMTLKGNFQIGNMTEGGMDHWQGRFTFTNATQVSTRLGSIYCYRTPEMPWWQQPVSQWWYFLLVPMFAIALSLWNLAPIKTRQFPIMVIIAIAGWVTNKAANHYIFNRSDIVSFIGAFVIGLLGNLYSRIMRGTAFTAMATGVLFLVPAGIASIGGLSTSETNDGDMYSNGLLIGFRMVQVAIGITVGLFFSSFIVYSIGGNKKGNALMAF